MDELVLPSGAPMPKREDEKRMRAAVDRIHGLIQKEIDRGIDSDRIVLAGFSQGESARSLTATTARALDSPILLCARRMRHDPPVRPVVEGQQARWTHVPIRVAADGLRHQEAGQQREAPGAHLVRVPLA